MQDYWFDAGPLMRSGSSGEDEARSGTRWSQRLSTALSGIKGSAQDSGQIADFAAANRLEYRGTDSIADTDPTRSQLKEGGSSDVVCWPGPPYVELGNNGWRIGVGDGGRPSRRGYLAVRHDLGLPYAFVRTKNSGSVTPMHAVAIAWEVLGDLAQAAEETTQGGRGWGQGVEVDPESAKHFQLYSEKGQESEVRGLLSEASLSILRELTASFDVHVTESWLFAYGYHGDVSTSDPEVWAWVFSVASRMLDLVEVWGELVPSQPGGQVAGSHRDLPFYTSRRLERPEKLDGPLKLPKRST